MIQSGGKVFGKNRNSIIYSNPRLPYLGEQNYDPLNIDECSKVFYKEIKVGNKIEIVEDIEKYEEEKENYKNLTYKLINQYFILPLNQGIQINTDYIKKDLSKTNPNPIFNNFWSGNEDFFKKATRQLTFKLGNIIKFDPPNIFYEKFKNIINAVKYMNNNSLLFDDLKLDNIVYIDNTYKIINCGSIIEFNKITEKFNNKNNRAISKYNYYIYSNILNVLLKYIKNKRQNYNFTNIISNYKKYINKRFPSDKNKYFEFIKKENFYIYIKLKPIDPIDPKSGNKDLELRIYMNDMINQILNIDNNHYNDNMKKYYNFLSRKFGNNISNILNYLQKKINIYCLGTIILEYFYNKNKKPEDNMLKFILLCCSPLYYIDDYNTKYLYVNDMINIDNLLEIYNIKNII